MCITHELSECAWCPSESMYQRRREALSALMERPARVQVRPLQEKATIVPAPSTDDFTRYRPGHESQSLTYTRQVPRLAYPHWAVTSEVVVQDLPDGLHYERSIYGEVTLVGPKRAW